ncbi:MAG: FKBP-type peptidyl-prolyl cis-trans isomerase [Puniceicoccales bacterium]|nr:FKBP-type peptidyl-prolyl cis-trans isomerase [Puniceicoccales bacterium]
MIKTFTTLALAAITSTAVLTAAETAVSPPPPPSPAAAPKPLTAEEKERVLEVFGWFVAQGPSQPVNLEVFGFTPAELDVIVRGFRSGAEGKDLSKSFQEVIPQLDQLMREKAVANQPKIAEKNKARLQEWAQKNKDHLLNVAKEQGMQTTPTGLRYKVLVPGADPKPVPSATVKAKYTGRLVDGTVFDSTDSRDGEPAEFRLDRVIKGWTEGLQKIGKGGKIVLHIPHDLAYGEAGRPGIPPMSTLSFEVELVEVDNTPPKPEETAAAKGAANP